MASDRLQGVGAPARPARMTGRESELHLSTAITLIGA